MKSNPKTASNRGFTLIEVIVSLILVGIMAAVAGMGIVSATRAFIFTREAAEISQKNQLAMNRLTKSIANWISVSTSPAPSSTALTLTRNDIITGGTVTETYSYSGGTLSLTVGGTTDVLCDGLTNFQPGISALRRGRGQLLEPGAAGLRPEYGPGDDDPGGTIGNKRQHVHVQGRAGQYGQGRRSSPAGQVRYGIGRVFRRHGRLRRSRQRRRGSPPPVPGSHPQPKAMRESSSSPGITARDRLWPVSSAVIRRPDGRCVFSLRPLWGRRF